MTALADIGGLLTALAVVCGAGWAILRAVRRLDRKFSEFQTDWNGTPGRPGVPRRSGVMERLDLIEHELTFNSGASLKDAVHRIDYTINGGKP